MSWIDESIAEFGRSMGLETLEFNDNGVLSLIYEVSGQLYLERVDDGVLIYLCREVQHPGAELYERALELCHWRHYHAFPVNPGVHRNNQLVFSVQLSESDVTVPALEEVIQLLNRLHDQVREGIAA